MKKTMTLLLSVVGMLLVSGVAFAAEGGKPLEVQMVIHWAAPIALGLAAMGCGIAQGLTAKAACESVARNPEASGKIMLFLILGLALIESLVIYVLLVKLLNVL